MTFPMPAQDETAALQAALDAAARARVAYVLPPGGHRLASTGLGYGGDAVIRLRGDLYNDHGPAVGTLYCLTNRTRGRLTNVTIVGEGGAFVGAATPTRGATRKGLGVVATDGFVVEGVRTAGPFNGFGMEIKNSTHGVLRDLRLMGGAKVAGADGLHLFGACSRITGSEIAVLSGDDALSFTCENDESIDAVLQGVTLARLKLDSRAFSCIKIYTGRSTGRAVIRDIELRGVVGRITEGPTGCPLMIQNVGVAQGCRIEDIRIHGADLDFGAATDDGPTAYITDADAIELKDVVLRGRRNGQFLRAVRCHGLKVSGEVWETIPGSSVGDMVQLESCGDYDIDLKVRSATGRRIGSIVTSKTGRDTRTRYIGPTGG